MISKHVHSINRCYFESGSKARSAKVKGLVRKEGSIVRRVNIITKLHVTSVIVEEISVVRQRSFIHLPVLSVFNLLCLIRLVPSHFYFNVNYVNIQ